MSEMSGTALAEEGAPEVANLADVAGYESL
jgi:hypothetical protein